MFQTLSAADIIQLAIWLVTLLITVTVQVVRADIRFRDQGRRIGAIESSCRGNTSEIGAERARNQEQEFKLTQLETKIGEVTGRCDELSSSAARNQEQRHKAELRYAEKFARIETTLKIQPNKEERD